MFAGLSQASAKVCHADLLFVIFDRHCIGVEGADDVDFSPSAGDACVNKVSLQQEEVLFK